MDLQKYILGQKNFGKGRQKWEKKCVNSTLPLWKLNTLMKTN
jgi:hypothetical protein